MRTQATLDALKVALQNNCGDMMLASKQVGVSLVFIQQWRKDDPKTNEELQEAAALGNQGLVSAAIQRAVHGVEEDVYYKGEVVGQKVNYSDTLLTTLLKAKVPEFSKDNEGAGTSVVVNIANVMPRAETYEQWLSMKQKTIAPPAELLPSPVDAEFTEVSVFEGIEL